MPTHTSEQKLHEKVRDFIDSIARDREDGYRFIPIVGSGISKPAGYPLVGELQQSYLPYCVARALGIDPFDERGVPDLKNVRWSPRSGDWPDMALETVRAPGKQRVTADSIEAILNNIYKSGSSSIGFPRWIAGRAAKALKHWHTTLAFLSEVVDQSSDDTDRRISITVPDSAVVDSFFRALSKERCPSLGHRMIQALSRVLRVNVLLTTNFDDLIEKSFTAVKDPLEVFDIPSTATLPDADLVLAQTSLIKMHGGRFAVRADGTVDVPPGTWDTTNFLGYLAGRKLKIGEEQDPQNFCDASVALLIIGSSVEGRLEFLLHLAEMAFRNLKIYCVLHGRRSENEAKLKEKFPIISTIVHPNPDLLLLELHQRLTDSIPTAGAIFPGMWELPMPPNIGPAAPRNASDERIAAQFELQKQAVRQKIREEWVKPSSRRPVVLQMDSRQRGGVALCAELFGEFRNDIKGWQKDDKTLVNCRPVWIDLDQVGRPVGVFLRLTLLAAKMNGDPDPISALNLRLFDSSFKTTDLEKAKELREQFLSSVATMLKINFATPQGGERLLVFLNAQEGLGVDSPFACPCMDLEEMLPDRDHIGPAEWSNDDILNAILDMLHRLNAEDDCGVQFVLIFRDATQPLGDSTTLHKLEALIERNTKHFRAALGKRCGTGGQQWNHHLSVEQCSPFEPSAFAGTAAKWVCPGGVRDAARCEFLWLLTLFRHARYPAGLQRIMRHLGHNTVPLRDWLGELEERGAIRFKAGGFVWMHPGLKVLIREALDIPKDRAFQIEFQISRWYGRLLLASADPMAGIESVYHSLHAVQQWLQNAPGVGPSEASHAQAALEHALLITKLAFPLFECRLTDRFAGQALANLQSRLEKISIQDGDITLFLNKLKRVLQGQRGDLFIREAEFERIVEPRPEDQHPPLRPRAETIIDDDGKLFVSNCELREAGARMLLRQYGTAGKDLNALWNKFLDRRRFDAAQASAEEIETAAITYAREWIRYSKPDEPMRTFVAKLARWNLQSDMQQAQIRYLVQGLPAQSNHHRVEERRRAARRALWNYHFGVEVLRHIAHVGDGMVWEENARLRAHAALYYLIADEQPRETERILDDAESFLDEFPLAEASIVRIVIQLRRAEAKIFEAGKSVTFAKFREAFRTAPSWENLAAVPMDKMQGVLGLVADALTALEIAESELRRFPKSRWWWWTFIVLKMKATEYLYTCRFWRNEPRTGAKIIPLPVVNFFWGGMTQLLSAKQMTDIFFLSRVAWAYSNAARAHAFFHLRRGSPADFSARIQRIVSGMDQITASLELAKASSKGVDNDVLIYAHHCAEAAAATRALLKPTAPPGS